MRHDRTDHDVVIVGGGPAGCSTAVFTARYGLDVVTAHRREAEGWWDEAADHTDWVVKAGRYEGEEWLENVAEYHAEEAPDDPDGEHVRERARELAADQQDWQIDAADVDRRTERAPDSCSTTSRTRRSSNAPARSRPTGVRPA